MRSVLILAFIVAVAGYGPPRPSSSGSGCNGGGAGCGGGQVSRPLQPPSSNVAVISVSPGSSSGGSGNYWWAGNNSPFSGPPAQHVTVTGSSSSGKPHPVKPAAHQQPSYVQQRPQTQPQQSFPPTPIQSISFQPATSSQNVVQPPMGICPASYVCVHWQLCRDGYVITDGSGNIDKRLKDIPAQVASRYESCGGDMICCGVPAGSLPGNPGFPAPQPQPQLIISQPQILAPAPSPPRPAIQPPISRPQILAPAPTPPRPAIQPPVISVPAPLPQPAPQPSRPVIQSPSPARPVLQPARPAPQPNRPSTGYGRPSVPAPQPSRPSNGYGRPPTPSNPQTQPTILRPVSPQPNVPISNPVGLVSPPSPQPMPMGMMGMMGMPMRGGSCSAGTYCVQPDQCNPYTGFIIRDPSQLMAVWPDAPTVPLLPCFVPDGSIQNGVCCQEAHPNAGGFD